MSLPVFYLGYETKQGGLTLPLFVAAICLCQFGYGFLRPCYETLINRYIPSGNAQQRATIMSFASMLMALTVVTLMIPSAGKTALATTGSWLIPATLLLCLTLVLHILMRRYQRKIGEIA